MLIILKKFWAKKISHYEKILIFFFFNFLGAEFTQLYESCGGLRFAGKRFPLFPHDARISGFIRQASQPRGQTSN